MIKTQLTKSDPKKTKGWKVPSLIPIRVNLALPYQQDRTASSAHPASIFVLFFGMSLKSYHGILYFCTVKHAFYGHFKRVDRMLKLDHNFFLNHVEKKTSVNTKSMANHNEVDWTKVGD